MTRPWGSQLLYVDLYREKHEKIFLSEKKIDNYSIYRWLGNRKSYPIHVIVPRLSFEGFSLVVLELTCMVVK